MPVMIEPLLPDRLLVPSDVDMFVEADTIDDSLPTEISESASVVSAGIAPPSLLENALMKQKYVSLSKAKP